MRTTKRIANAIMAAAAFHLAYTLWRIRQIVVARQREVDAKWQEATDEYGEE
jgi:hypothetical protein